MGIDHQDMSTKVLQQFAHGTWDHLHNHNHSHNNSKQRHCKLITCSSSSSSTTSCFDQCDDPSLSLGYYNKRMRPLAPKIPITTSSAAAAITSFDLKSFIRPERKLPPSSFIEEKIKHSHAQVETHPGGTRWNPTQEQIEILETLYKEGMRTPNAEQIEQITTRLSKYGKIEGKNVFYWFQNHKARERQKQKRTILGLNYNHSPRNSQASPNVEARREEQQTPIKRKGGRWSTFELISEENLEIMAGISPSSQGEMKTLELFPLHPEGR